jgi:hypothetical protein
LSRSCLLKHAIQGKRDESTEVTGRGEDITSYCMTLRVRGVTSNWKREHYITLCEHLALEEDMELSSDILQNE